jgi:hypothetical protein
VPLDYGWLPGPPWLLQEIGRSAFGRVRRPLLPAPLPPSVGGEELAAATGAMPTQIEQVKNAQPYPCAETRPAQQDCGEFSLFNPREPSACQHLAARGTSF